MPNVSKKFIPTWNGFYLLQAEKKYDWHVKGAVSDARSMVKIEYYQNI